MDRTDRLARLLEEALELPAGQRPEFVRQRCPDAGLRAELSELLAWQEEAAEWFDELGREVGLSGPRELEAAIGHPEAIGPYRVLEVLGRGGMGTVFLAERADGQFEQRVALKLIRRGLESEPAIARFVAERQILAGLEHPNVARLLDGGVTSDGLPWFVMEYVDGAPLTTYCDRRRLSLEERLRLFVEVADAVQYAHRNLLVHRDLKPGNVLVTTQGRVKLLDFGIAKLLDGREAGETTASGGRMLTPVYAAPEQMTGQPVTTATDVYSLGVMLYELLAGNRPHELAGLTPSEVERIVAQRTPPPPSVACRTSRPDTSSRDHGNGADLDDGVAVDPDAGVAEAPGSPSVSPAEIARARATGPRRLARSLGGDLDTICMMALRKEPERRYASAEQLVEDVERYLEGMPVRARPDTVPYRVGKFVRRHRWAVAATTAAALLLLGLAVSMVVASARVAQERDRAERVSELLVDIFDQADPGSADGATLTVQEVLERGAERVEAELEGQPGTQAELLGVLSRVYKNLGLYERALVLAERSLELREEAFGPGSGAVAAGLGRVGELLRLRGDHRQAEVMLRRALALEESRSGEDEPTTARSLVGLGRVLLELGRYGESSDALTRAVRIHRAHRGQAEALADALSALGSLRNLEGDFDAAEEHLREAVRLRRRVLGDDHVSVAGSLNALATTLGRAGDHAAAEELQRQALGIYRDALGEQHPSVATALNNLGISLYAQGRYDEAESQLREALALRRRLLGGLHSDVAASASNLGLVLQTTGRLGDAESLYREALQVRRRLLGDRHLRTGQSLNNLGMLQQAMGSYGDAESSLREGLDVLLELFGEEHPLVASSRTNLAALLHETGRIDEAEREYRRALAIRRAVLPPEHPDTAYGLVGLGRLLLERDAAGAAEPLLREALAIREATLPAEHWQVAEARGVLGACLVAARLSPSSGSRVRIESRFEGDEQVPEQGPDGSGGPYEDEGGFDSGELVEARDLLESALADLRESRGLDAAPAREVVRWLVRLHEARGDAAATDHYRTLLRQGG